MPGLIAFQTPSSHPYNLKKKFHYCLRGRLQKQQTLLVVTKTTRFLCNCVQKKGIKCQPQAQGNFGNVGKFKEKKWTFLDFSALFSSCSHGPWLTCHHHTGNKLTSDVSMLWQGLYIALVVCIGPYYYLVQLQSMTGWIWPCESGNEMCFAFYIHYYFPEL